ncbi:MAG: hypothetical protein JF571_04160 [Asticcacaulis sp.]|nr:hypothetical protein [Asticcacaulis sp.]
MDVAANNTEAAVQMHDPYVWKATDATPDDVRKADAAKPLTNLKTALPSVRSDVLGDVLVAGLVGAAIAVTLAVVNRPRRRWYQI